ncbi:DUF6431 domain-containing protein [Romboutsia sp.]|uniref:DUF6431 domain-containing protein n=1 Tax=Romboutsia sp. TaxID=1965302 RepID=UPI003F326BD3
MLLTNFPNFIQRIIKNSEEDFYQVINGCANCNYAGNLHRHASYYRTVICKEITARVKIQRVICPVCRKTHALIPSDLIPYFQHTLETVVMLLEMLIVKKKYYTRIIEDLNIINPCFSLGHITFYINRFKSNIDNITYYLRVYCEIFLEIPVRDSDIVTQILNLKPKYFNVNYFLKLNRSFMDTPIKK